MVEISVIIPVYNCEEYLDESVGGILNQTFTDIEVICVDDGSKDNSLNILKDFAKEDSRLQVFHQENQGGGNARNFALTKATGKYLYFMDADDIICPEALEKCYGLCEEKNLDFMVFKATTYSENSKKYVAYPYFTMDKLYEFVGDEVFSIEDIGDLIFEFSVTPWGKLYNRDFVMKSGAQFAERISFHDNKFFWEMLFNSKRICFLNETYYVRRIHSQSLVGAKNRGYFNTFIAFNQVFEIFRKYNHFDEFKTQLYNWKMRLQLTRYKRIHEDYKQEFFERYREEIIKMANEEGEEEFFGMLDEENRNIYNMVMECETAKEFSLSMEYDSLKNQNRKLRKDFENAKELNNELINSTSWKVTKPLRSIKRIIKFK